MKYYCTKCGTELVIGERVDTAELFEDGMFCPFNTSHGEMVEIPDIELPIELPIDKAIIAVETENSPSKKCLDCILYSAENDKCGHPSLYCQTDLRKDGKNVIFVLIDKVRLQWRWWKRFGTWKCRCPACKKDSNDYYNYCPHCGQKLDPPEKKE